jgi:hypothetical protein
MAVNLSFTVERDALYKISPPSKEGEIFSEQYLIHPQSLS